MFPRSSSDKNTIPSTTCSTIYPTTNSTAHSPSTQPDAPPTTPDGQTHSMTDERPLWDWEKLNASLNAIVIGTGDQTRTPPDKAPAGARHGNETSLSEPSLSVVSAPSSAELPQVPTNSSRVSLKRHRSNSNTSETEQPDSHLQHSRKRPRSKVTPSSAPDPRN
ncbi:hypothetical protein M231_02147 [Tremella mesenterica]|uniref:Uncharacterized protein n=1 Tax=Tremella mesenterica TaxID=5217 RepID=A0A4Q1BR98_TREME|nr:hypothetical protein M231_02147 [Tremella mesenterica]